MIKLKKNLKKEEEERLSYWRMEFKKIQLKNDPKI